MFNIYISNQFYYFLCDNRENLISRILLDYSGSIRSEYSFIDIAPEDKVTFLTTEKVHKIYKSYVTDSLGENRTQKYNNISTFIDYNRTTSGLIFGSNLRTEIKIGRLIKKIFEQQDFDNLYKNYSRELNEKKSFDEVLEQLITAYKCQTKRLFDENFDSKLVLLSGEDIRKYYDEANYVPQNASKGSLHESCMRYSKCFNYLQIYSKNPEVCQLLVFKEDDDKISMRALVWKLTNGKIYMDRVYSATNSDSKIFVDYAKKNGWLCYDLVMGSVVDSNKQSELIVEIKNIDAQYYPYMDTFMHLSDEEKRLAFTARNLNSDFRIKRLRSQGGGWG